MTAGSTITDTNILMYAEDLRTPTKRERARQVLGVLSATHRGVLTAQILAEYFDAITRKQAFAHDPCTAAARVAEYRRDFVVLDTTSRIVQEAARGVCAYGFRIYDAQIWATARLNGISLVLSEDFGDGAVIEGVRFANPFEPEFELEREVGVA